MIRLLADEDFDENILEGMLRRGASMDAVRVKEVGLSGANDPKILEWAANQGRILLTHDVSTMTRYARERLRGGERMAGVFVVHKWLPIGRAIEHLLLICECTEGNDWAGVIQFIPL